MVFPRHSLIWLVVLILGANANAIGAQFWVAQTPNASDQNPGTKARPWKTISKAALTAKPADTVWVLSGDYRQEDSGFGPGVIPFTRSGTVGKSIRFAVETGQRVLVRTFLLTGTSYLRIEGFEFSGRRFADLVNWSDMPTIVRSVPQGTPPVIDFLGDYENRRVQIETAFAAYFSLTSQLEYESALDLEDCNSVTLLRNKIDGYWAGIQCRHCAKLTITSNNISHCVNGIYTWRPAPALVDSVISKNIISQSLDNGIDIREQSRNVVLDANRIRYSGRSHISLQETSSSAVRNNDTYYGGYYSETMLFPGSSAISINASFQGNLVEFNLVGNQIDLTQIDGNGIIIDRMNNGASVTVRGNIVSKNMGDGLNMTMSPNTVVYANAFMENGFEAQGVRRGAGIKLSRDQDINQTIYLNIFAFNRAAGILSYRVMDRQKRIDFNTYLVSGTPLIWDGYDVNERSYRTLAEVQLYTGWEKRGRSIP